MREFPSPAQAGSVRGVQSIPCELMERLLHGIEGLWRACEQADARQAHENCRARWHRLPRADERHRPPGAASSAIDMRFSVSVPVLSVHSTVAEPSVSIAAARRVSTRASRNAPRAHRHEHGEHDRKLFRQHGHAERDAGEHRVEPSAAQHAVKDDRHDAHAPRRRAQPAAPAARSAPAGVAVRFPAA